MDQQRWQQVWSLYSRAQSLPPAEWGTLVAAEAGDPELRQRVLRMLEDPQTSFHGTFANAGPAGDPLGEGTKLGRYRVVRSLGRGGMGDVYAAFDEELSRPAALKVVAGGNLPSGMTADGVMREAKAASALNHPHIVTVYEVIPSDRGLVIAMERIDGVALRELCGKALPIPQVARFGEQIARALEAAHRAGIVHRDVKPENIMVRTDGYIKLLDFGLARGMAEAVEPLEPLGTWRYMSPEQVRGEFVGPPSDVFSLGLVLYELSEGHHPFQAPNLVGTLRGITAEEPGWPRQEKWAGLLRALLAKKPEARPAAGEAAVELARMAAQAGPESFLSRRAWAIAAGTLATGAAWWALGRRQTAPWADTPLAGLPGAESMPELSPDGQRIAFVFLGDSEWNAHVYIKTIGASIARLTEDPRQEGFPCWSPDGREIAFFRQESGGDWTVLARTLATGEERCLGQVANRGDHFRLMTWMPDATGVLVSDALRPADAGLPLIALTGEGRRRAVTAPPPGGIDAMPRFSPDGRSLAFVRLGENGQGRVLTMPFPGGRERAVSGANLDLADLDWAADGKALVLATGEQSEAVGLNLLDLAGGTPRLVRAARRDIVAVSVARRGGRVAYQRAGLKDANIWEYPLTAEDTPRILIASNRFEADGRYSPDGQQIAFLSDRGDSFAIWVCRKDGSAPRPVTAFGPEELLTGSPAWSPDGARIAFDSRPAKGKSGVYWMALNGREVHPIALGDSTNVIPEWSHDGSRIYFSSDRSGAFELWWIPAEGGTARQFTHGGGFEAFPSPDGEFVYFTRAWEVAGIWRQPVSGGPAVPIPELSAVVRHRYWQGTRDGIWFVDVSPRPMIKFYDFQTGKVRSVTPAPKPMVDRFRGLSIAPDCGHFLYLQYDVRRSEIWIAEGARWD